MRFLLFLILMLSLSCSKEEQLAGSMDIRGQWLQTSRNQVEARYVTTARFGEFDYGLVFFDNGRYTDRSESGICIGENCLTEDFYGTYRWLTNDVIELNVENYHGKSIVKYSVSRTDNQELVLKVVP